MQRMKIGELARLAGCPVVTIRFYEKEGLLAAPERSQGNYRLYGEADLERLRFVMHCRRHGMKLGEIRELLAFRDRPTRDCAWIHTLVDDHIANVEAQIESLKRLKQELVALRGAARCGRGERGADCAILASLSAADGCPYCEDLRCRAGARAAVLPSAGATAIADNDDRGA